MVMKKIYKLKQWYTIEEACEYLSLSLNEAVSNQEIVQMAIENHILLSWHVRNLEAVKGRFIDDGECPKTVHMPNMYGQESERSVIDNARFKANDGNYTAKSVESLVGFYNLDLKNCHTLREYVLEIVRGGEGKEFFDTLDGLYVLEDEKNGWLFVSKFDEDDNIDGYFPVYHFPELSDLGFQKKDLDSFVKSITSVDVDKNKPLHPKREASLLRLAIVMAKGGYGYDENILKSPVPKEIEEDAQKMGVKLTDDTIRAILKESVEYLDDL